MSHPRISAAGMRILRLLIGHPPRTMNELIEATGVTRTAITEQINDLLNQGFIRQTLERLPGRGRPRFLYTATELAQKRLFEGNQNVVFQAVWESLKKHCSPEVTKSVYNDIAQKIADQFNAKIRSQEPAERLREFYELASGKPRLLKIVEKDDFIAVSKLSCPFITMYEETGAICAIDALAMEKIVQGDVQRTAYRYNDASCCSFCVKKN